MFGLFKPKPINILAPSSGEVMAIELVNDEVFSKKMVGDGVAIIPTSNLFVAPFDGTIIKLFPTLHAYSIQHKSGLEAIVHIGLETVSLKGEGFEALCKEGDTLKAGEPIVRANLEKIKSLGKEIVTPIVITNMGKFKELIKRDGTLREDKIIMEVK